MNNPGGASITLNSEHTVHVSNHVDPLGDDARPATSGKIENELLALQVQAFLEASEDVDVDAETIEDILEVLVDTDENVDSEMPQSQMDEDEDSHDDDEVDVYPLVTSTFPARESASESTGKETWTKQETKQMLHLLKERGAAEFIDEYVKARNIPVPKLLAAFGIELCPELQNRRPKTMLYFLRVAMSHQLRNREKLQQYNTIDDAVQLIQKSKRILILTGAGISVSCGIPDFRSRDGLYASLKNKGEYDLDDPQQMFDIHYFKENPSASQIYPSNFVPSPCHRFIKAVENNGKLLRNYTQNIDTLETLAGVERVLQCHGSFAMASCLQCRERVLGTEIEADILGQKVPLCKKCNTAPSTPIKAKGKKSKKKAKGQWDSEDEDESDGPVYPPGIMKPDITFFGEKLTDDFDHSLAEDRFKVDLLLIIGTSLKVSPVAEITSHLPHSIPQILINKTPIRHINPDIVLLGNADDIVLHLCNELGWELPVPKEPLPSPPQPAVNATRLQPPRGLMNMKKRPSTEDSEFGSRPPERIGSSHVWLFDGAEGGRWLQQLKKQLGIQRSVPPSATNSGYNTRSSTPVVGASPSKEGLDGRRETKKPRMA
ncbi:DHS-like NAD/FAD-binding domain-containing protein [Pholiota conissans]|uniref:DHS-like NAD/FAD-binding domain-containing protein n=1 Tax=Pholiota conissans TaxID=109636 RepID=A0A9P5Z7X6_9AGAR|nr:DHS-like NAD/FAD-binding domain-containing protein [Pholiota conissans]